MKGKKEDKVIRDLFRHKLENAEVIPSLSVGKNLMPRLARKEFMHFIPSRFNIWYALAIATAGAAIVIVLLSGSRGNDNVLPDSSLSGMNQQMTPSKRNEISATSNESKTSGSISVIAGRSEFRSGKSSGGLNINSNDQLFSDQRLSAPARPGASGSLPNETFFPETYVKKFKLRGVSKVDNIIIPSANEGCIPLKVRFTSKASDYRSIKWTFGDEGYSEEKNPEWIFDVEGEYEIIVQLFGPDGLKSVSSCTIKVYPKPVARFEIIQDDEVLPDEEITFNNYSTGAVKFKWFFGDGTTSDLFSPQHSYLKPGNFNIGLVATSEFGCSDSLIVKNALSESGYFIEFPNAFIPNPGGPSNGYYSIKSDESAYVFHPESFGVSDYQLKIFSKRGVLMFESNDLNIGWDGYYKGQLSNPGVYIWKVRGNFINREPFIKLGDVTLLKNKS